MNQVVRKTVQRLYSRIGLSRIGANGASKWMIERILADYRSAYGMAALSALAAGLSTLTLAEKTLPNRLAAQRKNHIGACSGGLHCHMLRAF
jgi:hypothetical protein